jgi:hypothetical protein
MRWAMDAGLSHTHAEGWESNTVQTYDQKTEAKGQILKDMRSL